jgi:hypothetical protein
MHVLVKAACSAVKLVQDGDISRGTIPSSSVRGWRNIVSCVICERAQLKFECDDAMWRYMLGIEWCKARMPSCS